MTFGIQLTKGNRMNTIFSSDPAWGFRSVSFWMVMLVAAGLAFIGIRFLVDPLSGAYGFGIPFRNLADNAFGKIKGIRDLYVAVLLFLFLRFRQRRLTALIFGTAIIIPFTDGLIVIQENGISDLAHIVIHWGTVLFSMLTVFLLCHPSRS